MDMKELIETIPEMAEKLGAMMATEALPLMVKTGISLDGAEPSVSITFQGDGAEAPDFIIRLSIECADDDADEEYPDNGPTDPAETSGPGRGA